MFLSILRKIESKITGPWFNPFMTIYINFRLCPIKNAIRLPIFIYGTVWMDLLSGKIIFPDKCYKGMIRIGKDLGHFSSASNKTHLFLADNSKLIFHGKASFAKGCSIRLTHNAVFESFGNTTFGDDVKIMAENYICIGEHSRIAFGCQIIDTNFHYILDLETSSINRKSGKVIIGANNWIGNRSSIMKDTVTPDWCIVGSGSLLNKNYGDESFIILAGAPAKIVKRNKKRIYDLGIEVSLDERFCKDSLNIIRNTYDI